MPSLGEAFEEAGDEWERRRLYVGATLIFVGALVAAPGLARVLTDALVAGGVAPTPAVSLGVAAAALAIPLAGATLFRWVSASPGLRAVGATGVVVATLAIAAFLAVPPGSLAGPADVPLTLVAVYAVGAMLALWSPIVAAGLEAAPGREPRSTPTVSYVRSTRRARPGSARVPSDGGEDESRLSFPLDDE